MVRKTEERLLRWDDVQTESQRQRLIAQTIAAMRELLAMPARKELIKDIMTTNMWDGTELVVTCDGFAIRDSKYSDSLTVFWDMTLALVGINVKNPATTVGWIRQYEYLNSDKELAEAAIRFRISAKDIYKVKALLEV